MASLSMLLHAKDTLEILKLGIGNGLSLPSGLTAPAPSLLASGNIALCRKLSSALEATICKHRKGDKIDKEFCRARRHLETPKKIDNGHFKDFVH